MSLNNCMNCSQQNESEPLPQTKDENLLKMYHRPQCKSKTSMLLKENIDISLSDLGLGNGFLAMTPKAQAAKKMHEVNFKILKSFCFLKCIIKKVNKQLKEWENMFAKHVSDNILLYRIHKEFTQLNNKKTN